MLRGPPKRSAERCWSPAQRAPGEQRARFLQLAGAALSDVMITAIRHVHGGKGPWVTEGGYEYNLVLLATDIRPDRSGSRSDFA